MKPINRNLLLLAMAWAVGASAADGEWKWKQVLDTRLVDEWQTIFSFDAWPGYSPRPAETFAQKMVELNKVIAKSTGGKLVPMFMTPEVAAFRWPKQKPYQPGDIPLEVFRVPLRDFLRYITDCSGCGFKITDEGILIFVRPKPEASITQEERTAIEAVIKKEATEKILAITRETSDTVEVHTGVVTPGKLKGKGQTFTLKRTKKGWEIQKRGLWVS